MLCSIWVGDSVEQFDVYLTGDNGDGDTCVGAICPQCYEEYKVSHETKFIVKKH